MIAFTRWVGVAVLVAVACSAAGQTAGDSVAAPVASAAESSGASASSSDVALDRARAFVENSDRYLHHAHLKRGMTGYGKTVMAGVEIERFEVEIVSVMTQWGPHQDVILARLSGLGLEKTNVIAGMSGSPVYVVDPRDGKEKMIGAVAYGWSGQKEPLCGLQPITQMLAVNGVLGDGRAAVTEAQTPGRGDAERGPAAAVNKAASKAYLEMVLGRNEEFVKAFRAQGGGPAGANGPADVGAVSIGGAGDAPVLLPLRTPLMVSGLKHGALLSASAGLRTFGMMPVQAGNVAGLGDAAGGDGDARPQLEPGSGIAVPIVRGDAALSAVGTVTEVIDGKVLAFGHAFYADGDVQFPMGPAYIHGVVAGIGTSFKLGALTHVSGALTRDESVGILGAIGKNVDMIPMTVQIEWKELGEKQQYNYDLVRHRMFTPRLAGMLVEASVLGWKNLPETHTLRYTAVLDFGELGVYKVENVSSNYDTMDVYGEVVRPILAMFYNPWQQPPELKSVAVSVTVEEASLVADVLEFKLDGKVYQPGDTVTGTLTVEPYRQRRTTLPVTFELPGDLPEGTYTLEACDASSAAQASRRDMPQRFDPRNAQEMLDAVAAMAVHRRDCVYLRLPLPEGGVAIRQQELPNLPASKAVILAQAGREDVKPFRKVLVRPMEGPHVFRGAASATFEVSKTPR